MAKEPRQIFRQKSLEKLSSPERLDQLLRIVKPQSWILLVALGVGFGLVLTWSVVGSVPTRARGAAILVKPKQVISFQSPAIGQIDAINVVVGQDVNEGDLLATLKLPSLEKQLEQAKAELELVQRHGQRITELELDLATREKKFIAEQRELIADRIGRIQKEADSYKQRSESYVDEQAANLVTAVHLSEKLGTALEERFNSFVTLHEANSESKFALIEPRSKLFDNQLRRAELELQATELDLRRNNIQEYYDDRMDRIRDLRIQSNRQWLLQAAIDRRLLENELKIDRETKEIQQTIVQLETHLSNEGRIQSNYAGRILEITTTPGHLVTVGQRLGKMEIEDRSAKLKAIAYFRIKDGKRIRPGNSIRISPSTVERERFGGIVGTVDLVSDYPVTIEAAAHQIGDQEIARNLLGGESRIEVVATLEGDATSSTKYRWTSGKGPEGVKITPGTTADVRVTIESRAPITLVMPFLKSLLGTD